MIINESVIVLCNILQHCISAKEPRKQPSRKSAGKTWIYILLWFSKPYFSNRVYADYISHTSLTQHGFSPNSTTTVLLNYHAANAPACINTPVRANGRIVVELNLAILCILVFKLTACHEQSGGHTVYDTRYNRFDD
jgi:hypothetical protein